MIEVVFLNWAVSLDLGPIYGAYIEETVGKGIKGVTWQE
jgi:hypothetical protein